MKNSARNLRGECGEKGRVIIARERRRNAVRTRKSGKQRRPGSHASSSAVAQGASSSS